MTVFLLNLVCIVALFVCLTVFCFFVGLFALLIFWRSSTILCQSKQTIIWVSTNQNRPLFLLLLLLLFMYMSSCKCNFVTSEQLDIPDDV